MFETALFEQIGPDAVYLTLMVGLWLAITAVYIPGTGAPELGALATLAAAFAGLWVLPTNLVGVILLIAGAGCFLALVPFRRWWWLILAGAALQVAGSIFLFQAGSRPSIGVIGVAIVLGLAYHQLILRPGLRIQDRARQAGPDTLIGALGEVIRTLEPVGTIRVEGAIWAARADGVIESGRWVRVVGREGLELHVGPVDERHFPTNPPG
jgi:membrane-bound serine protease (ClpP class)